MKNSTTPPLPLIAKIAIAMTFLNVWVIFEETVVDRHGLWRYMPFYRVGLFCVWDAAAQACPLFDEHLMTCFDKAICAGRHQTDTVLILLDLPWHADDHGYPPLQ